MIYLGRTAITSIRVEEFYCTPGTFKATEYVTTTPFPEQVWCKFQDESGTALLVGVCYRTRTPTIFDEDIDDLLWKLLLEVKDHRILLMGDFNYGDIDWTNPLEASVTVNSKLFLECVDDCFFTQHVLSPTTQNGKSVLDLVITSEPDMVDEVRYWAV
jgi:Endonuclease-reverse transcriptase